MWVMVWGWRKDGKLEGLGRRWTEGEDGFGDGDVLGAVFVECGGTFVGGRGLNLRREKGWEERWVGEREGLGKEMGCGRGSVCEVRFVGDGHWFGKGDELQREKCWKERWTGVGDGLERQKGRGGRRI